MSSEFSDSSPRETPRRKLTSGMRVRITGLDPVLEWKEGVLRGRVEATGEWYVRMFDESHGTVKCDPIHIVVCNNLHGSARSEGRTCSTKVDVPEDTVARRITSLFSDKSTPSVLRSTSQVTGDEKKFSSEYETSRSRAWCARALKSFHFDCFVSCVILLNFFLIVLDTDARANYPGHHSPDEPPAWVGFVMHACFCVFAAELLIRMFVMRWNFLKEGWNILDFVIVVLGLVEYCFAVFGLNAWGFGLLRVVRLCRLLRLLRALRLFAALKELRRLIQMMSGCFKTLFWSFCLLILIMTIWATVAVELINPHMQELEAKGFWADCPRCSRAFASVFNANLTLFQTVVAGDSWGLVAVPIIEEFPVLAVIFTGSLMTLVFGVLNLIVAVIVDTFAENRQKDLQELSNDMEFEEIEDRKQLFRIFAKIDADASGTVSYQELESAAKKCTKFRQWLRVLDIDAEDMRLLFTMVDADGSGDIDANEFVEALYRMKNTEPKTAVRLVKAMLHNLARKQEEATFAMGKVERVLARKEMGETSSSGAVSRILTGGRPGATEAAESRHGRTAASDADFSTSAHSAQNELSHYLNRQREVFLEQLRLQQKDMQRSLEDALEVSMSTVLKEKSERAERRRPSIAGKATAVAAQAAARAMSFVSSAGGGGGGRGTSAGPDSGQGRVARSNMNRSVFVSAPGGRFESSESSAASTPPLPPPPPPPPPREAEQVRSFFLSEHDELAPSTVSTPATSPRTLFGPQGRPSLSPGLEGIALGSRSISSPRLRPPPPPAFGEATDEGEVRLQIEEVQLDPAPPPPLLSEDQWQQEQEQQQQQQQQQL